MVGSNSIDLIDEPSFKKPKLSTKDSENTLQTSITTIKNQNFISECENFISNIENGLISETNYNNIRKNLQSAVQKKPGILRVILCLSWSNDKHKPFIVNIVELILDLILIKPECLRSLLKSSTGYFTTYLVKTLNEENVEVRIRNIVYCLEKVFEFYPEEKRTFCRLYLENFPGFYRPCFQLDKYLQLSKYLFKLDFKIFNNIITSQCLLLLNQCFASLLDKDLSESSNKKINTQIALILKFFKELPCTINILEAIFKNALLYDQSSQNNFIYVISLFIEKLDDDTLQRILNTSIRNSSCSLLVPTILLLYGRIGNRKCRKQLRNFFKSISPKNFDQKLLPLIKSILGLVLSELSAKKSQKFCKKSKVLGILKQSPVNFEKKVSKILQKEQSARNP